MLASTLLLATVAAATPFPRSLYLPAELRLDFGAELTARQFDNGTLSSAAPNASVTPAPAPASASASASPSFFVTTYAGETYTYAAPEAPVAPWGVESCSSCVIRVDDICKSVAECMSRPEALEKRLCEKQDQVAECYKCSRETTQLSEAAQLNMTTNKRYCAKRFGIGSGALSSLAVSGGAVAAALVAFSTLL
ncbi:hypothetical protein CC85DRAFT_326559 [Cutaneotrichosporon oleaginosum]|uniref:Uncharacterized protein n=1 Tax=Cutaneotrichosporon oleaginosum TaxID=879819 RepID=A0A0J0XTN0_9TREE|nr:uncharacterized protein CC85DRAFT_326559 [Cutaneotrichosporon oleaginosum]KLT44422.1 hypothetical protein CC85DRAFT_326559 [Cutaneotrichosporon oleaginosum]TXT07858.1 hypothetical protein COLE_04782 [Cutaneotrichosporon oleaginosum]